MEELENKETVSISKPGKKAGINPKVFIIGLPLFIVQLVVVYFITANILLKKNNNAEVANKDSTQTEEVEQKKAEPKKEAVGKYIYTMDDIIVNPAGTSGQRLMLASVNIDVGSEEQLKFLKERDPIIKDLVISTMSSKSLLQLAQIGYKDSLKVEISAALTKKFGNVAVNDIYFSKYIMQ